MNTLNRLSALLLERQETTLARWRAQVQRLSSARKLDLPTLNDHIPGWIRDLAETLMRVPDGEEVSNSASSPPAHGQQRFEDGFDIEEVVAEYNILRDCVYELAEAENVEVRGRHRRAVDLAFDTAIGAAVKAFAEGQAREVERRRAEHLAFVAHDLRTPLSAISMSAHALGRRLEASSDPQTHRTLKILGRNATQLENLVNQVLTENTQRLTELGLKLERRTFDLWPVVEGLIQNLEPLAAKTATRVVNEVPEDLYVRADASLLRRILQNLVTNAIAYTAGGKVRIGARDPGGDLPVECYVTDNGTGIAPERMDKVFEPLESDPERDGVGLGLAIVKTYVEAHDGIVSVESTPGQGSTFRFTLPRREPAPAKVNGPVVERAARSTEANA